MTPPSRSTITTTLFIIGILVVIYSSGIYQYWSLTQLKEHAEYLSHLVALYPIAAPFAYILFYIVFTACSIPEGVILTIAGGFLFGAVRATCYILFAATTGATIAFLTIRYSVGKRIQNKYAEQLAHFNRSMKLYGAWYLLMIRFIVIIPFFLVNILAALTPVSLSTFIWTTAIGLLPGTFAYALAGQHLLSISSMRTVLSGNIFLCFIILALLALSPIIIQHWRQQRIITKL